MFAKTPLHSDTGEELYASCEPRQQPQVILRLLRPLLVASVTLAGIRVAIRTKAENPCENALEYSNRKSDKMTVWYHQRRS